MEDCTGKHAKLQKSLDVMELKQVLNNEDAWAISCSTVTTTTIGATINEISRVK